jgi:hypothetical protein
MPLTEGKRDFPWRIKATVRLLADFDGPPMISEAIFARPLIVARFNYFSTEPHAAR